MPPPFEPKEPRVEPMLDGVMGKVLRGQPLTVPEGADFFLKVSRAPEVTAAQVVAFLTIPELIPRTIDEGVFAGYFHAKGFPYIVRKNAKGQEKIHFQLH